MSKIYVMVGLPGSGKSTVVDNLSKNFNICAFSSDTIREKLFGDAAIQGDSRLVFDTLYKEIREKLKEDKNSTIVLDATNINRKDRKQICAIGKQFKAPVIAIVLRTPLDVCLERNHNRERVVPDEAIYRMVSRFEYPLYEEGFYNIIPCAYNGEMLNCNDLLEKAKGFDQHNIHHTEDLYNHMRLCCENATKHLKFDNYKMFMAGLYHDIGKLYTQTGPDENENCHYLGHANWSAYLFLSSRQFVEFSCKLINYHMIPYLNEWEKFEKKFKNEPDDFIDNLKILHDADINAH